MESARLARYAFASWVSFGAGGAAGFGPKVSQLNAPRISTPASAMTIVAGEILTSGNGHLSDHNGRGGNRTAEFQIAADFCYSVQHLLQSARDCDLRNRKRQLAVAYPDADSSARVIAGNYIDAAADQFSHIEAVLHAAQNLRGRFESCFDEKITMADAGVAG